MPKDNFDYLWVLKICVWCKKHILPDDLQHTVDPQDQGQVWFEHRDECPLVDPLLALRR